MPGPTPSRPKTSVLICALDEERNLPHVLPQIPDYVDEVILVDGHSGDRTVEVARALRPGIRIVRQPGRGKGIALRRGVEEARGDIIVTLDADGETHPADLPRFIGPLLAGYDFVRGSRLTDGRPPAMSRRRWFGNKVLASTCNLLFGTRYTDVCSGYNAFWKSAFQRLNLRYDGFAMEQELAVKVKKADLKVLEVPHHDGGRINGASKTHDLRQGLIDWLVIVSERFRRA
ncbi:MAG: glycosyltransferase family 2 protein [Chloroflexi bacterium]|nr:glycosyltransferase family 2 protein [Chloroflexota bacterium]